MQKPRARDDYSEQKCALRTLQQLPRLVARQLLPASSTVVGHGGQRPVAPNTKPDGSDDPEGRARNRRVEVVINICE